MDAFSVAYWWRVHYIRLWDEHEFCALAAVRCPTTPIIPG